MAKETKAAKFCRCIKSVRKTVKLRSGSRKRAVMRDREAAAIAICTKSILQSRGRTLKRVRCRGSKGPQLVTQPKK